MSQATDWLRAGWRGYPASGQLLSTALTPQHALTLSAYFACLRNLSEDIGKLPLCVYRRVEGGKERAPDHPLYALLHDSPNPEMTAITFRSTLTHHAAGWGNGYAWIMRDGPDVMALYPLHPSRVVLRRDDQGRRRYLVYGGVQDPLTDLGGWLWVAPADMVHVMGLSWDGLTGYSIASLAAQSLGLSLHAETFGERFFANGAFMSGILEHPGRLSDTALSHLRESFTALYAGSANAGKPAILEEGMKWHPLSIPPEDAQFLQTRQFQIREIARWFRMPPHKIADLADAHFTNIESQNLEYVTDTLMPWLVRWEQELKRKLFADEPEAFAEHEVRGLLRGDHQTRAQFYKTLFEIGVYSPNEIRGLENENPIGPEGDEHWVAANNLQPLKQIVQQGQPMPPANPESPFAHRNGTMHAQQRD